MALRRDGVGGTGRHESAPELVGGACRSADQQAAMGQAGTATRVERAAVVVKLDGRLEADSLLELAEE